jgi:ATP synthase protein I
VKSDKSAFRYMGWVTGLGVTMIASMLLGLFFGMYLDGKLNTSPWLAFSLLILGMISGAWSVYKGIMRELNRDSDEK